MADLGWGVGWVKFGVGSLVWVGLNGWDIGFISCSCRFVFISGFCLAWALCTLLSAASGSAFHSPISR